MPVQPQWGSKSLRRFAVVFVLDETFEPRLNLVRFARYKRQEVSGTCSDLHGISRTRKVAQKELIPYQALPIDSPRVGIIIFSSMFTVRMCLPAHPEEDVEIFYRSQLVNTHPSESLTYMHPKTAIVERKEQG